MPMVQAFILRILRGMTGALFDTAHSAQHNAQAFILRILRSIRCPTE